MLVTLVLMANLRVSFFVLVCVVMTVVNVCGYSHFMGITIEIVTSIILILSCGLALDYAAHIGVAYMCSKETTRNGEFCDWAFALASLYCRKTSSRGEFTQLFCAALYSLGQQLALKVF